MLSQDAGRVERGRRRSDVAIAAAVEDVVVAFVHEQFELGHHRLDGVLVGGELGDGAGALFRSGQQSLLLGASSDNAFLVAHGGKHLGLNLLVECGADVLGDIGGRADIVLCQAEVAQSGLGLSRSDQVARGLKSLLDVAGELLASNVVFTVACLECGTRTHTTLRLVGSCPSRNGCGGLGSLGAGSGWGWCVSRGRSR